MNAIVVAPNIDPIVPRKDIAPDVPFGTFDNLIKWNGLPVLNDPISLAQVSAVAAAITAR